MPNDAPAVLLDIPTDRIDRNPDNPRILFRPDEMDLLLASIRRHGIQVPLAVYKERSRYVLIDGERRWRCATKLNLKTVPAIITEKPSPLRNLLLMFNIHSLREQWDYFTIAHKLPRVIELFVDERGREPTEPELSDETGLSRGQIRRCRLLLELPEQYTDLLLKELERPKAQQKLTEDFFLEMERALKTVQNRLPDAIDDIDHARNTLIDKFRSGAVSSAVELRKVRKIATSVDHLGVSRDKAVAALEQIFDPKSDISVSQIFTDRFESQYDERKALLACESLADYLGSIASGGGADLDDNLLDRLRQLRRTIDELLGK